MLFDESEFKPVVRFGKELPGYYVSKDGRVFSTKSNSFKAFSCDISKRSKRVEALKFNADVDVTLFDDYEYCTRSNNSKVAKLNLRVHKAVMDAWKPIDEYPPEHLKSTWNDVPEEWRQWVRDTAFIDHIDDDPTNNHVDNLRWVTPKQNSCYRKKKEFSKDKFFLDFREGSEEWEKLLEISKEQQKTPEETIQYLWDNYISDVEERSKKLGIDESEIFKMDVESYGRTKGLAKFYQSNKEKSD